MLAALEFLWRVRNEMHLYAGRKHDQMSFDLQEHIADAFGYEPEGAEGLPVEGLMRDYYRHARNVLNSSSLVMEQCLARVHGKPRRRRVRDVEDGLRIADGQLEIPHTLQLRRDPLLLLRAFAVAQRHDVPLTRKARRLIRENLDLIDDAYRRNPEAVAIFLDILRAERRVTRTLTAMNEVGLLGRFLPEWEHIVNRWQHVMYHTYTVDVHSIFLVEEVRRLWKGDFEKELPGLTQLVRDEDDLLPLILGCLLHDIGKGFGGDHSPKGAVLARTCLERIGADPELIDTVEFLVREHLVMSHIAQRRDLSDPRLVLDFARTVGSRSRLRLLYLLTVVDIRASSKKAWTEWKGNLLQELFEKTSELLETGADDMERATELFERRVETRRQAAAEELRERGGRGRGDQRVLRPDPAALFHLPHADPDRAPRARGDRAPARSAVHARDQGDARRVHRVHPVHARRARAVLERRGRADRASHEHPRRARVHDARRDGARGVPRRDAAGRRGLARGRPGRTS